ncbi:MAG: preprotein translocase subunit SecE [Candidatus Saccharibacteria bacterium]|nr:preprotein translocase subunit SecE [Candidatus Saccharibacteria bacterium]
MADTKKKKSAAVRTRVVEATDPTVHKKSSKKSSKKTTKTSAVAATKAKKHTAAKAPKKVGYFKGAWLELKQVRWPNRKLTWSMTLAVIIFTIFITALVLLLDAGFKFLFDFIIK